jgi:outer membrane protein
MKNLLLTTFLLLSAMLVDAQISRGTMMIGGSVEFNSEKYKTEENGQTDTNVTSTSFTLSPEFGYFVVDNLALGAGIGLYNTVSKNNAADSKNVNTGIAVTPFVRYYLGNVFFHGQAGFGSGKNNYERPGFESEGKSSFTNWNLGAGYAIFLNDNVAIEPTLGYQSSAVKYDGSDEKSITGGLYLRVGIQVYLRR